MEIETVKLWKDSESVIVNKDSETETFWRSKGYSDNKEPKKKAPVKASSAPKKKMVRKAAKK